MAFIPLVLTIYIFGLILYFFQGNFTGSIVQNGCLLFTAGTGFVLKGFWRLQRNLSESLFLCSLTGRWRLYSKWLIKAKRKEKQ